MRRAIGFIPLIILLFSQVFGNLAHGVLPLAWTRVFDSGTG